MNEKAKASLVRLGLVQASEVALYCSLVGLFFWKVEEIFGEGRPNYFGPVAFLLLFSASALICALIVFYKPYRMFFDDKKREAIDLVLYTTAFLFLFFLVFLSLAVFVRTS